MNILSYLAQPRKQKPFRQSRYSDSQNPKGKMRNEMNILSYLALLRKAKAEAMRGFCLISLHASTTVFHPSTGGLTQFHYFSLYKPNFPRQSTNSFPVSSPEPPPASSFALDVFPCEVSDEVPPFSPPAAEYP